MVYLKGSSEPTTGLFLEVKKDSCIMPIWNTSFQSPNNETRPICLQPSVWPSIFPQKTFKREKLKLNHVNSWNHRLAIQSKGTLTENETGIFLVDFSQVEKHKPCLFGCWLLVCWLGPLPAYLWCPQLSGREELSLFWSFMSPVVRASIGGSWGLFLGEEGNLALPIESLEKDEECPK